MLGEMCRSYESAFSLADAWMLVQVSGFGDTHFEDALNAVRDITPEDNTRTCRKAFVQREFKRSHIRQKNVIKSGNRLVVLAD